MSLVVGVTGGSGFIGKRLVRCLISEGFNVILLQRSKNKFDTIETRHFDLNEINTINKDLLDGINVVIHIAALVHNTSASKIQHNNLNFNATKKLFDISRFSNVKKFIFISTVGVYGLSHCSQIIDVQSPTNPKTAYSIAKLKSEDYLLSKKTNNPCVSVIRLPLVYGDNAPGNFGLLEKIAKKNISLPFGSANNKRSIVSVELTVKVLVDATKDQKLYLGLNLLADPYPTSTKKILTQLRQSYGMSPKLFPAPKSITKLFFSIIGKHKVYEQLYEDLVFSSSIDTTKYN
ncbi:NAD-dependent epimerase/dehydratase family protein [Amylibacter sp.]|nr:NAD-dependent epimerase/dehydratase family protein [Amylibacter sp.]